MRSMTRKESDAVSRELLLAAYDDGESFTLMSSWMC